MPKEDLPEHDADGHGDDALPDGDGKRGLFLHTHFLPMRRPGVTNQALASSGSV